MTDTNVVNISALTFGLASTQCMNITDATRDDCNAAFTPADNSDDATPADATDDPITGDILIEVREVQINVTGAAADDANLTFTLNKVVDLPNDLVFLVP